MPVEWERIRGGLPEDLGRLMATRSGRSYATSTGSNFFKEHAWHPMPRRKEAAQVHGVVDREIAFLSIEPTSTAEREGEMAKVCKYSLCVTAAFAGAIAASSPSYAHPVSGKSLEAKQFTSRSAPTVARTTQPREYQRHYVVAWARPRVFTRAEIEGIRVLERMPW
jgi:hypothetical protein